MTRWRRDIFRDALWEHAGGLSSDARAVAEVYARHADDDGLSSATYPQLMASAGLGRRAAVSAANRELVRAGWLVVARAVSRRPTVYRLAVPGNDTRSASSLPRRNAGRWATAAVTVADGPVSWTVGAAVVVVLPVEAAIVSYVPHRGK